MSLPTTSFAIAVSSIGTFFNIQGLKKKANKTSLRVAKFSLSCFPALEGLYCNDMHKSHSSKKQQPIHGYSIHLRYIGSNTLIEKLF